MKTLRRMIRWVWMMGFAATLSPGTTYYVATQGADTASGSAEEPWRTVQKALDVMQPGDTANVAPGFYDERVVTKRTGSPEQRIRLLGAGAILRGVDLKHAWHIVEGFEVTGVGAPKWGNALSVGAVAHGSVIASNRFHDLPPYVYAVYFGSTGGRPHMAAGGVRIVGNSFSNLWYQMMYLRGTSNVVEGNTFEYSNGYDAIRLFGTRNVIRRNLFRHIDAQEWWNPEHADLLQNYAASNEDSIDHVFEENVARDCTGQIGNFEGGAAYTNTTVRGLVFRHNTFINVGFQANVCIENVAFLNNTFYRVAQYSNVSFAISMVHFPATRGTAEGGRILNNIFYECGARPNVATWGWYYLAPGLSNVVADYNFVCGSNFAAKVSFNEPHGINGGNPGFVGANGSDLCLRDDSPLRTAGLAVDETGMPLEGDGPHFVGSCGKAVPKPPSGLRVVTPPSP